MSSNDVLISCNTVDAAFAKQLADDLRMVGFNAAIQPQHTHTFKDIAIQRLLLVISQTAIDQHTWHPPFEAFAQQGRPICAVRVDTAPIPTDLERYEWVDFTFGYQSGVNGIKMVLMNEHTIPKNPFLQQPLMASSTSLRQLHWIIGVALFIFVLGLVVVFLLLNNL